MPRDIIQYIFMKSHNQHKSREKKPTLQDILVADCDVCFSAFEKVAAKKLDEGLQILLCGKCYIHVHKCCYDFQPSLTVISSRVSQFLCDRCVSEQLSRAACVVCLGEEGAMKRISEKQVVHVFCGLMHNDIEVTSYYPAISFKKSIHYQQTTNSCEICHRKNAHDNCAEESCKKKAHAYCAKKLYSVTSKESQDPPACWNHKMSSGNHGVLDLSDQIIPYELFVEEFDIGFKEIQDLNLQFQGKEIYLKKIYKEYIDELRSKRKSTKKLRRGGFSYLLCPQHEATLYCICYGKADSQQMVLCQCCFQWYHPKCVKYVSTQASYICQYCKVFYQFKKKAIQEVKNNRIQLDMSKVQLPLKISVMDCMWVMRMIDNRIKGGMAAKMLKQLNKYPIKSSCMELLIRHQNRNKLTSLADQCLKEFCQSEGFLVGLKPKVVLGCGVEGVMVLGSNVEWNRLVRKGVEVVLGLGVRAQGLNVILRELDFKDRATSDQYEQIIQLSKVEQKYQEVQILKQKAQAYNFIEIIKKINQRNIISFDELQHSITNAKSIPSLPHHLTQTLNQKYSLVAPTLSTLNNTIRDSPENTYLISQCIEKLTAENMEPPLEYKQLRAESKLIQDVYLYYIKLQGQKMSQELTIQQQINILLKSQNIKAGQQLLQIVNNYKSHQQKTIWPNLQQLHHKLNIILIEYELKELLKRKVIKHQKFMILLSKVEEFSFVAGNEEVLALLGRWKEFRGSYDGVIQRGLEDVVSYEGLEEIYQQVQGIALGFQSIGIKFQEDGKNGFSQKIRNKKQEIEQLKILYTQGLLNKHPLTLNKLLSTLPKNNPLVNQYNTLKKEQSSLHSKYTTFLSRISQKLQLFKIQKKQQRKDQIKFNNQKPSISEINEFIQILKSTKIDMSKEIRELTRIINNSLDIGSKIKKFIENKSQLSKCGIDELNLRKKEIQEFRKKILVVAELNLSNQLLDIYHMEIRLRMRIALLSPSLELEKIRSLLSFAEQQNLDHDETYIILKQNFDNKNKKYKEVNLIKNIENELLVQSTKDDSGYYSHLYNTRRMLTIPDPNDTKTKNHQYLEDLIEKNKVFREKLKKLKTKMPNKWDFNEAKAIYVQALKNPFQIPQITQIHSQFSKAHNFYKHWKETFKYQTNVDQYIRQYDQLLFTIEQIQTIKRQLKNNQEELSKLNYYINNFDEKYYNELEDIVERIENNNIIKDNQICREAEVKYLKFWIKLLNEFREKGVVVPYEKIKRLLFDGYNLLQKFIRFGENYDELRVIINELEDYIIMIRNHLKGHPVYHKDTCLSQSFIDLQEFYLENDNDDAELVDLIPLLRPFNDLAKFRTKNLQRIQYRKDESSNYKRNRDRLDDLKLDSQKNISIKELEDEVINQTISNTVGDTERKKIKQILLKNIRKNLQLKKYGQHENEIKMIENQIFGQWHNDIVKYLETSEEFQKLFIKLVNCPNISNKLIKKKFQFKFIQILITNLNKLEELESMLMNKAKQQETEKTITKISESIIEKTNVIDNQQENIMNSIATGKIDDHMRQEIKKEMKLLKESKHKKKKHHKHRSRSKSPDAKFSSESQEKLPKHIEEEYYKNESKSNDKKIEVNVIKMNESPLRYDPQEQQLQKKEVVHPKGSILKLKNIELEITSKKRGRIVFPVQVLTQQEHKKIITELIDPGFSKLAIRKDKNQVEIIQYINKSKKKYKYLVCWFQAVTGEDNEWIREMSMDVNEKKKIYGWQNENIKMHIMSIKQLVQITRFNPPSRVASSAALNYLNLERMIMVIQYPQRIYEIKDSYKPFSEVQKKAESFDVVVPQPIVEPSYNIFYPNYNIPTIQPTVKPFVEEPKMIYEGGWGSDTTTIPINPPTILPIIQPIVQIPIQPNIPPMGSSVPFRVNQIRMHFGFGNYSPINSDEEDAVNDDKNKEDLASNLLNQLGDFGKKPNNLPPPTNTSREPMHYQQQAHSQHQQQYPNYYGNYSYQHQPQAQQMRPHNQGRYFGYQNQNQGAGQTFTQNPAHSYNTINPMTGKYATSHLGQQQQQQPPNPLYKNPMMNSQRNPPPNPPNPQFYRPPYGGNDDYSRYQGGYQQ